MSQEHLFASPMPLATSASKPLVLATLVPESVVTGTARDGQPITVTIIKFNTQSYTYDKTGMQRGTRSCSSPMIRSHPPVRTPPICCLSRASRWWGKDSSAAVSDAPRSNPAAQAADPGCRLQSRQRRRDQADSAARRRPDQADSAAWRRRRGDRRERHRAGRQAGASSAVRTRPAQSDVRRRPNRC